ncbi:putative U1-C, C2H2-type zinc finger, Zinc finger C2H2 superfamily [Helianthus annuus]|nr:putative U1-C, C2H2-type zinc finger, Zinc finger C2H2 superfamily [Helianthus annuus]
MSADHTHRLDSTMPRYYCDYCDTYLTHDSVSYPPSVYLFV